MAKSRVLIGQSVLTQGPTCSPLREPHGSMYDRNARSCQLSDLRKRADDGLNRMGLQLDPCVSDVLDLALEFILPISCSTNVSGLGLT